MKIARIVVCIAAIVNLLPLLSFAVFSVPKTIPPEGAVLALWYFWPNSHILLGLSALEIVFILFLIFTRPKKENQ